MRRRVAMWGSAGFLVAVFWAIDLYPTAFPTMSPVIRAFAQFTQPVLLISSSFHAGLTVPWVLLANAMTYALVGLAIDKLRQEFRPTR